MGGVGFSRPLGTASKMKNHNRGGAVESLNAQLASAGAGGWDGMGWLHDGVLTKTWPKPAPVSEFQLLDIADLAGSHFCR